MNRKYSQEHIQFLAENIKGRSLKEIVNMFNKHFGLNLKESTVISLIYRTGLHNDRDCKFNKGWEPTQFKKGHVPANKGLKGVGGWEPTQFKKGNVPANRLPIGAERVDSKDGYIYIKIQDGHLNKNWKPKHVAIWEKLNGPVPKGFCILFGNGNKLDFDTDNLICVSRKQLVRLNQNGLIQSDIELTKTGIIIADVMSKVGDRKRGVS